MLEKDLSKDYLKRFSCIPDGVLEHVNGGCLFYPCSGNDLRVPLDLFFHRVSNFVFVDHGYFRPGDQNTRGYKMDLHPEDVKPLLEDKPGYCYMGSIIYGEPTVEINNYFGEPCQLTEVYQCLRSGRSIRIHRIRDNGLSALDRLDYPISIFFYRGDSFGDGDSGDLWLGEKKLNRVIEQMINLGIVVIDGSNVGHVNNPFYALRSQNPDEETVINVGKGHKLIFVQRVDFERKTNVWRLGKKRRKSPPRIFGENTIELDQRYVITDSLIKLSDENDAQAQMRLGISLIFKTNGTGADSTNGLILLEKSANQGYEQAIRALAYILNHGTFYGLPTDKVKSLHRWMHLADLGKAEDQYQCLCLLRHDMFSVSSEDRQYESAVKWEEFREEKIKEYSQGAINQGHLKAQLDMDYYNKNGFWPKVDNPFFLSRRS